MRRGVLDWVISALVPDEEASMKDCLTFKLRLPRTLDHLRALCRSAHLTGKAVNWRQ